MKIGIAGPILIESLNHHLNAPEGYLQYGMGGMAVNSLINGLIKLGHQVSVYTLDSRIKSKTILRGDNLNLYIGNYRGNRYRRMLDNFYFESRQIRDFIREDNPEIVNAQWSYEFAMGAIMSKYPHLITFRDESWEILKHFKDLYRASRLLLDFRVRLKGRNFSVNSNYLRNKLKNFRRDIPVVPNPINEEEIVAEAKPHPENKIRILSSLSGWTNLKNPHMALKAFKLLRDEFGNKVEYHLFGKGYETNGLGHQWAKKNDLLQGVYFHGAVEHSEMMDSFSDNHIMLHPSLEESFGNPLIEAMAKGLPVVGGEKSGAVPWVLNYGKNGILVNVKSYGEIYKGVKKLVTDKQLYEQLSKDGISYVRENFSSSKVAMQYVRLYEEVIFYTKKAAL